MEKSTSKVQSLTKKRSNGSSLYFGEIWVSQRNGAPVLACESVMSGGCHVWKKAFMCIRKIYFLALRCPLVRYLFL